MVQNRVDIWIIQAGIPVNRLKTRNLTENAEDLDRNLYDFTFAVESVHSTTMRTSDIYRHQLIFTTVATDRE